MAPLLVEAGGGLGVPLVGLWREQPQAPLPPSLPLQFDISKCHYLVDLDTATEAPREPRYAANKDEWVSVAYKPFLDSSR